MSHTKCPHCGVPLGNFLYADVCPACRHELVHNTRVLIDAPYKNVAAARSLPVRLLRAAMRLIES